MSASANPSAAPLGVDDVLADLLEQWGKKTMAPVVLPVPTAVAKQHRVQFALRGRRFETTMDVAVTYCLTFYLFFHCPFIAPTGAGGAVGVKGDKVEEASEKNEKTTDHAHHEKDQKATSAVQSESMTVGDVAVAEGEAAGGNASALSDAALLSHYITAVEPRLQLYLDHCATSKADQPIASTTGVDNSHKEQSGETERRNEAFTPPPLPRPRSISYDAAAHVWKFEFPPRLTAEEEEQERRRLQRVHASSVSVTSANTAAAAAGTTTAKAQPATSSGEKHITSDEINASPFLLLQNDFMGVVLVFLRRCGKVRSDGSTAYPALPIRWHEMTYDEQVSLGQLVRAFGIVPLAAAYASPTASVTTSQFVGAQAAAVAAVAAAEGAACSLRVKAEEFFRLQQEAEAQAVETNKEPRHSQNGVGAGRLKDDFDDGLVLQAKGCARCGMAGHATEECPY